LYDHNLKEKEGRICCHERKQVILTGIDAHVCVLQTADASIQKGYKVHGVADTMCSWRKLDWETGPRWMGKRGGDDLEHRDHRLSSIEGGWN
jgi:isochorismate hydrolase